MANRDRVPGVHNRENRRRAGISTAYVRCSALVNCVTGVRHCNKGNAVGTGFTKASSIIHGEHCQQTFLLSRFPPTIFYAFPIFPCRLCSIYTVGFCLLCAHTHTNTHARCSQLFSHFQSRPGYSRSKNRVQNSLNPRADLVATDFMG
jgi:hypothetical protein